VLTVEEALARCLAAALPVVSEEVPVAQAAGRVLAAEVLSTVRLPPWDNSAMDGYALRAQDTAGGDQPDCESHGEVERSDHASVLRVIETIAAGGVGTQVVGPGTCARIMTGAPMPAGADAVVMREHTDVLPGEPEQVRIHGQARPGQHLRRAGEELVPGDRVLVAGQTLGPAHLGLLASLGQDRVQVARCPRVAVISTGDELVPPGRPLGPGQIHASNGDALCAWVAQAGAEPVPCGIAGDSLRATRRTFQAALDAGCDLLLSSGGVSVGDFDHVKAAMADVGAEMGFWKVRMKPGKPLAFGVIGGRPCFGLPGNPVSCQVNFLQFVRPVLRRSLGDPHPFLPVLPAVLEDGYSKRPGRAELVRVHLRLELRDGAIQLLARSTGGQGSARSSSMAWAHGLVLLSADGEGAPAGSVVSVQVFDGSFAASAEPGYRWS